MKIEATIDRIEEGKAVLMDGEEKQAVLPASWIPGAHEGMAVNLSIDADPAREQKQREEAEELLKRIKNQ